MQIAVLGTNPALSLAELTSLYGAANVSQFNDQLALINLDDLLPIARLGGSVKVADLKVELNTTSFNEIERYVAKEFSAYGSGKLNFGISVYGKMSLHNVRQLGLNFKKSIRQSGRSVRFIPNKTASLSSAQVLHNQLAGKGLEIIIGISEHSAVIGSTKLVQNIDAYSERDYQRPKRDPKVGMLPPKLAQIMLNLANPTADATVLDPFCGTGVVLQEALLMGYRATGSDIDQRLVDYSKQNLEWLQAEYTQTPLPEWKVGKGDARSDTFPQPIDAVVAETYLGPPLSQTPYGNRLEEIRMEVNNLVTDFLKNLAGQVKSKTPVCVAVPAWHADNQLVSLPLIDQMSSLGYNFKDLSPIKRTDLIYRRPNQAVGRQLVVLEKQ